ncbi:MAG TPA: RDD family protein [Acidimicrobiia bacterium]|nr:RDD family protein [Acidimicrobiia bacterium]
MAVDDYYALFGVAPDASTEEIRDAYRDKKASLDAQGTDSARAEAARVNRAWNVLSDAYQRGRYDEQLANARAEGADVVVPDGIDDGPPRRRRLFEPPARDGQPARPVPQRTVALPAGARPAERRARVLAMVFDLTVLVLVYMVVVFAALPALADSQYPDETDLIERVTDRLEALDDAQAEVDDAPDDEALAAALDDERARGREAVAECEAGGYDTTVPDDDPDTVTNQLEECLLDVGTELVPFQIAVLEGSFLIGLVYLVVPSALGGQTLGKRLRGVRAVRADGSPLGWGGAILRYGAPVLAMAVLYPVLRELALLIVLFGVLAWMRNPNEQGLHDRLAKTVVVDADQ